MMMGRWKPKALPPRDELERLFRYDPDTGEIHWRLREAANKIDRNFNARLAGKPAGTRLAGRDGNKYLVIGIRGSYYKAHRVIWKLMTGNEPPEFIDHRDGNNFNNRWANLRKATNGTNLQNAKLRRDNKTGFKGVVLREKGNYKKYRAVIAANKIYFRLGDFDTPEEAAKVRKDAAMALHLQFARSN